MNLKDWQAWYDRIASSFGYNPDYDHRTFDVLSRLLRGRTIPILFGSGNVTDLLDIYSVGLNTFLAGVTSEVKSDIVLTTEEMSRCKVE